MTEEPGFLARTRLVLGDDALERLSRARVAVFGLGGVGGHAVEALARSGVGSLDLVDADVVEPTNLNRQILALRSTVGQRKVDVAARRVADINPDCAVKTHCLFYLPETAGLIDLSDYDCVVDAVDTVAAKVCLACKAQEVGVPLVACMGTGNKIDPSALRAGDLYETSVCPLARAVRKECRARGVKGYRVVYSTEDPRTSGGAASRTPGSTAFVPGAAGLLLAAEAVSALLGA